MTDKKRESLRDRLKRSGVNTTDGFKRTGDGNELVASPLVQGDLKDKPISWILEVANDYEVTGHLIVGSSACSVNIQFGLGKPLHSFSPVASGLNTIIDLFTWEEGKFYFENGKQPEAVTISLSPEEIVHKGEAYVQDLAFLERNAISDMSFLLRPADKLSESDIENRLRCIPNINLRQHIDYFNSVYGSLNIKDIAEKLELKKYEWVSTAANLLRVGLILAPNGKSLKSADLELISTATNIPVTALSGGTLYQSAPVEESQQDGLVQVERVLLEEARRSLNEPGTETMSSKVFLYMLDREFARASRFGTALALIVFSIDTTVAGGFAPNDLARITAAISRIKRDVDMFGRFGDRLFGLILPGVDSNQARVLVERIMTDLPPSLPDLGRYNPTLRFGIASAPTDVKDIDTLMKKSQLARLKASETGQSCLLAADIA